MPKRCRRIHSDFFFNVNNFHGEYRERNNTLGKAYYEAMNVMREDKEARHRRCDELFLFQRSQARSSSRRHFAITSRVAGVIGIYGQTLLLSLAARGLGGIPRTALCFSPLRSARPSGFPAS
jgi:hypothetical protein